jgi:hypothetical protein
MYGPVVHSPKDAVLLEFDSVAVVVLIDVFDGLSGLVAAELRARVNVTLLVATSNASSSAQCSPLAQLVADGCGAVGCGLGPR